MPKQKTLIKKKMTKVTHQRQQPAEFRKKIVGWCSSAVRASPPVVTVPEAYSAPAQAPFPSSPWHLCCPLSVQKKIVNKHWTNL